MSQTVNPNIPNLIMMVRPKNFGFNPETADSNSFQSNLELPDVAVQAQKEFDNMVGMLESENIQVKVFEDLDKPLPDSVFPNNWISHIPNGPVIIYPMSTQSRQKEIRPDIVEWCQKELNPTKTIDYSLNVNKEKFLEGTGSIVFDHTNKKAYACESPRTDLMLLSELCTQELSYATVTFKSVDLEEKNIYHTNVMMSIGSEIAIICLDAIPNILERSMLKESLRSCGKEIVELSYPQMNDFAGNALEVVNESGQNYYVMSETAFNSLNKVQIQTISKHAKILTIPIPTIEKIGGGSVRCMMAGLFDYPR